MGLPPRSSVAFWAFLTALAMVGLVRLDLHRRLGDVAVSEASAQTDGVPAVLGPGHGPGAPAEAVADTTPRLTVDTIGAAGSIYQSLKVRGVPELEIARLGQALDGVFDAQKESKSGDVYRLLQGADGGVLRFEYTPDREPERPVLVERAGDALVASRPHVDLTRTVRAIEVVIEDNVANAIAAAGESDALTDMVLDYVFGSVIDFQRDPRRGDRLGLVFTRLSIGDRFVRYGRVLLARYDGEVTSQCGIYYDVGDGDGEYYDTGGNALERMFLLKPMEFRRISSAFNRSRFHPILKRNMPHLGTDYAAATGTRVWSTASGRVAAAGWNGGYGKMVEVEHANGYRTRYAHLSRILVKRGQRVGKHTPVGLVGATGRATGPHLHYELLRGGRQIDPATVNKGGPRRSLPTDGRGEFLAIRDRLEGLLDEARRGPLPMVADAALDSDSRDR